MQRSRTVAPNINVDRASELRGSCNHGDPSMDPSLPLDVCDGRHEPLEQEAVLCPGLHAGGGLHTRLTEQFVAKYQVQRVSPVSFHIKIFFKLFLFNLHYFMPYFFVIVTK